jgi:ribosomal protein S27AE
MKSHPRLVEVPAAKALSAVKIRDYYPCFKCGEGVLLSVRWDEEEHPWIVSIVEGTWFTVQDGRIAVRCARCAPSGLLRLVLDSG